MRFRYFAVALAVGASLVATGCSQSGATKSESSTGAGAAVPTTHHELTAQDRTFLAQVDPFWKAGDQSTLILTATTMCERLQNGGAKADLYRAVHGKGHDHEGDELVDTAIKNYCPQYQ